MKYPERDKDNCLIFPDYPKFRPNLTPKEIIERGGWCNGYFRKKYSNIANRYLKEDDYKKYTFLKDLPKELMVADIDKPHDHKVNRYKVHSSLPLEYWEESGWIREPDYRGAFQHYCEFYNGRRIPENDEYQINRWIGIASKESGRWRTNLINKIYKSGKKWDDESVSPVIRQTLLHWFYELTEKDYNEGVQKLIEKSSKSLEKKSSKLSRLSKTSRKSSKLLEKKTSKTLEKKTSRKSSKLSKPKSKKKN
jgi:hypothetical protein